MKRIIHGGYTITATANNDAGVWQPLVSIRLGHGPRIVALQDERRFQTELQAEEYALVLGKQWVQKRLQRMQKSWVTEDH